MEELNKKIKKILNSFNNGNHVDAFTKIEALLDNYNNNIDLLLTYGVMCSKLNHNEKAINIFNKILSIKQNHVQSLNYLYINYLKITLAPSSW